MKNLMVLFLILSTLAAVLATEQVSTTSTHPGTMSAVWHRTSGEYVALCHQAYNLATTVLAEKVKKINPKNSNKRPAIVLDIDETVLDNFNYTIEFMASGQKFSVSSWKKWVAKRSTPALAGAKDFLQFADKLNVEIFYISNRADDEVNDTFENLRSLSIPVKKENLLFKSNSSSKDSRRIQVEKNHEILLFVGDNLIDFSSKFDLQSVKQRVNIVNEIRAEFGAKFIIIPNSMYGDWESAIYKYDSKLSTKEKEHLLLRALAN